MARVVKLRVLHLPERSGPGGKFLSGTGHQDQVETQDTLSSKSQGFTRPLSLSQLLARAYVPTKFVHLDKH